MPTYMEQAIRKLRQPDSQPLVSALRQRKVAVVIPAYNEERFIGSVVLKILQYPVTVIVVDDGSSDDTARIAERAGATVVRHEHNKGKGEALNSGICAAAKLFPDAVVAIDGDGQHLPEQLPALVWPILEGQADIVVGSRYLEKTSTVPRQRLLGHWFFNKLTAWASQVAVTDSQSGFRAFSPKAIAADLFHCTDFSVESEMQFIAHEHGLRVLEVPITIRYTDKAKRSPWMQGLVVLNGILRLTGQYRPLLFFGLPGAVLMTAGIAWGLWVYERFQVTKQLATGNAIICMLLFISGMVMLSTGVTLHSVRGLLSDMLRGSSHHAEK